LYRILDGEYIESPGYKLRIVNPVGAGDAFAAGFLHSLSKNLNLKKVCDYANLLGAYAIKNKSTLPEWTKEEEFTNFQKRLISEK